MKLLFVYGTLKRGFQLNGYLKKARYLQDVTLQGYTLFLYTRLNFAYPYMMKSSEDDYVSGELWEVSDYSFAQTKLMECRAGYWHCEFNSDMGVINSFIVQRKFRKADECIGNNFTKEMQDKEGVYAHSKK